MRLLLDTNVVLAAIVAPKKLRPAARAALADPENELYVSAAAVWEIVMKHALGKLPMPRDPAGSIPAWFVALGFRDLPILRSHVLAVARLPSLHRDPFDRIMIAQALVEGLTISTRDPIVRKYPVPTQAA
jgi:PIN domain nuclease of toxin-antitoxin system